MVADDLYKALMIAAVAALGKIPKYDLSKPNHRNAWNALKGLYQWMVRATAKSGAAHVVQRLKDFSAECRLAAIEGTSVPESRFHRALIGPLATLRKALEASRRSILQRDMVVELSHVGRALPKGRKEKEGRKALQSHYWSLGSAADPLPVGRREELVAFGRRWADQHLKAFTPHLEYDPTAGACLEKTRKDGGLAAYLHEKMRQAVGDAPRYVKRLTTYPTAEDDLAVRSHAALTRALVDDLPTDIPRAQAVVVCERGFKVRVVTKSPGSLVALCHQARRWLAEGLQADPAIKAVLAGDHRQAVEQMFGMRANEDGEEAIRPLRDDVVVSADLKSATDLIGRETYEALWDGILSSSVGKTLPKYIKRAVAMAIGPQVIEYPDLGRFCRSKRGALMGLPTTWAFLCLANLAWWDLAHNKPTRSHRQPRKVTICGDDLVGGTSPSAVKEYEARARESGAVFSSKMKHIVTRKGGVFTEEVFFLSEKNPTTRGRITWSEAFPIRGILGTMRSDKTGREEPYWVSLGPALEQMMLHRTQRWRRAMLTALRASHPELKEFLREHGLKKLWHVPRVFGGIGIPRWDRVWSFPVSGDAFHLRAAFSLAAGGGWDSDLTVLSKPYSTAMPTSLPLRKIASQMAEPALAGRWKVVKTDSTDPPQYLRYPGRVQTLLDTLTGNVARDLFFLADWQGPDRKSFTKTSGKVARRLAREVTAAQTQVVTKMGGWTCGKAVTFHWDDLLRKMDEIEDSRRAIYNPALVQKRYLADLEWAEVKAREEARISAARAVIASQLPLLPALNRKSGQRVAPLMVEVLGARAKEEKKLVAVDRPEGASAPIREWADRQTKRLVGEAMGWFHPE
jgi:hypothetical protein